MATPEALQAAYAFADTGESCAAVAGFDPCHAGTLPGSHLLDRKIVVLASLT